LISKQFQTKPAHETIEKIIDDAQDNNDELDDTILSSIPVHCDEKPKRRTHSTATSSKLSPSTSTGPSCTSVLFDTSNTNSGSTLYTAGNAGSLACLDTQRASHYTTSDDSILWKINGASPHGITALYQLNDRATTGPLIVTGDEEGVVRLWDSSRMCGNDNTNAGVNRTSTKSSKTSFDGLLQSQIPPGCVATFKEHSDYISGFEMDDNGHTLLATSADGTLSVFDIRMTGGIGNKTMKCNKAATSTTTATATSHLKQQQKANYMKFIRKSDDQDDELLSLCKMKSGKKVICGTQSGALAIWSWGTWGDISDRFPGHPQSIDAMLKVDESTILTGSGDGLIRALQIHPNQLLGILGDHAGFPVEKLLFSAFRKVIGSVSHDTKIRLWDASILHDENDNDNDHSKEGDMEMDKTTRAYAESNATVVAKHNCAASEDDWDDMDDSDDSDHDSMDCDLNDDSRRNSNGKLFKTENDKFFEDL